MVQPQKAFLKIVHICLGKRGSIQQLALIQQAHQKALYRINGQPGNVIRQAKQLRALSVQPSKTLPASLLDKDTGGEAATP